ncbi:YtxH domain-containing protein [Patescibacteria group bacterium]
MFFRKKKKKEKKKKKGMVDKVVMGAIIGGAIGSVVGMSVAPNKGEETRKYLKEKGKEFIDEHEEEIETLKKEAKAKGGRLWKSAKKIIKKR